MGYHLNRLDELVFMVGPKPMQTEFSIHHILESCGNGFKRFDWQQIFFKSRHTLLHPMMPMANSAKLLARP